MDGHLIKLPVTVQKYGLMFGMLAIAIPVFAAEFKDPTRPPWYATQPVTGLVTQDRLQLGYADSWVLSSTLISGTQKLAMINGRLLGKGDKVGNMTVVDIRPDKAVLRIDNENIEIMLVRNKIKSNLRDNIQDK